MTHRIINADVITGLQSLNSSSVQTVVTSPPYSRDVEASGEVWGLRDYGVDGQIGLEPTPDDYLARMVAVFREVKRVLRDDGTAWVNMGDAYAGAHTTYEHDQSKWQHGEYPGRQEVGRVLIGNGLKPKDLIGMPWRLAFALQEDGWYLRSDIIWCLSGGTWLYVKSQKGVMPMTVKDLARLAPDTVELWNGIRWTMVKGVYQSPKPESAIEIVLRSGERIGCTEGHVWPTTDGDKKAADLKAGDVLKACQLPNGDEYLPYLPAEIVGWFVGTFLADGSWGKGGDVIQIASRAGDCHRLEFLQDIASRYHGTCREHVTSENGTTINLYGKILAGILHTYIEGSSAKTKHLKNAVWQRGNSFLKALLIGYLEGDGHYEPENRRWRLGFTRNYLLERDLRIICARLGYSLTLNMGTATMDGRTFPAFKGEIRSETSGHHNEKPRTEIVEIRRSRGRGFWDIEVEDEPHLFALASGVLTHNSKPNPMPESVTDRPTKSHEYVFLLAKRERYYYDADAIREPHKPESLNRYEYGLHAQYAKKEQYGGNKDNHFCDTEKLGDYINPAGRNRRTVWEIATQPTPEAHFATYPEKLVEPCIKAGTSERGCCRRCGAPWVREVETESKARNELPKDHPDYRPGYYTRKAGGNNEYANGGGQRLSFSTTIGWRPSCTCDAGEPVPCVVLDPFAGSGTTLKVARDLGRDSIGIELNPAYVEIIKGKLRAYEQLIPGEIVFAEVKS